MTLAPGESVYFGTDWDQIDTADNPVPVGTYVLFASLPTSTGPLQSNPVTIHIAP